MNVTVETMTDTGVIVIVTEVIENTTTATTVTSAAMIIAMEELLAIVAVVRLLVNHAGSMTELICGKIAQIISTLRIIKAMVTPKTMEVEGPTKTAS